MNPVLPPIDPIPLPAPVWLFQVLEFVTFLLHVIAMNLLLGGGFLAAISGARGREGAAHHRTLADLLFRGLPVAAAATISLGVAPLLFIQVLYGRFFYTSSILIAVPWFGVIALLCLAYYGHYFMSLSGTIRRERMIWVAWIAAGFVAAIGFIYVNNITLMQSPGKFLAMYQANRWGARLNLDEPTLIPRYLHILAGAFAVSGLAVTAAGQRLRAEGDGGFGLWTARHGRNWFAGATLVQVLVGLWFLFSQPPAIRAVLLGGNPVYAAHLFGGIFLALVAVMLVVAKPESRGALLGATACLVGTLIAMLLVRGWVRTMLIGDFAGLSETPVRTQWSVLAVFVILFAGALVTIGWMTRRLAVEPGSEAR